MYQKIAPQLYEINRRNEKENVLCFGYLIGNNVAVVTVEDIFPNVREKYSVFVTVEFLNCKLQAFGYVCPDCILFPRLKFDNKDYRQILHKLILLQAGILAAKYRVDCVLFIVEAVNLSYRMNLPFWRWLFKKSSGTGRKVHTFAATVPVMAA